MAVLKPTYIEAISALTPSIDVTSIGDGTDYDLLVWQGGDPLPSKAALDILVLEKTKTRQWRAIQEIRDTKKAGGVKVGANWFHSDESSRIQQLGLVMFGANLPAGIMWKTLSGNFVAMTPTLAQQIFMAVAISDQQIFGVAEQKKVVMNAMENPQDYDQESGWPIVYTGE
jgi:hypothetical protein